MQRKSGDHMWAFAIVSKKFLYLVQAESCLPLYFTQQDVIGNATNCQCVVLVLSYKKHCHVNASRNASHIQDGSNTTWTSGRNALYHHALQRNINYHFYVFADDDVRLVYNSDTKASVKQRPELRTFAQNS